MSYESDLDDDSLDSAGRLVGASFCGRPHQSNVSAVSSMSPETDYTDDDECGTSMAIECFSDLATNGGSNPGDWQSLAREQLGKLRPQDAMKLAPIAENAAKKALKMWSNPGIKARVATVAEDIQNGKIIAPSHPSLQFGQLDDDSLTALSSRQWANLQTTDLMGNPL